MEGKPLDSQTACQAWLHSKEQSGSRMPDSPLARELAREPEHRIPSVLSLGTAPSSIRADRELGRLQSGLHGTRTAGEYSYPLALALSWIYAPDTSTSPVVKLILAWTQGRKHICFFPLPAYIIEQFSKGHSRAFSNKHMSLSNHPHEHRQCWGTASSSSLFTFPQHTETRQTSVSTSFHWNSNGLGLTHTSQGGCKN